MLSIILLVAFGVWAYGGVCGILFGFFEEWQAGQRDTNVVTLAAMGIVFWPVTVLGAVTLGIPIWLTYGTGRWLQQRLWK